MSDVVLVTGCSTGIGRATAERFRDAGWDVYATARDPEEIRDLEAAGCRVAELDVTDGANAEAVVDRVFEERGRLDCLVNNAGYGQFGAVEDVSLSDVREQFEVNAFGPMRLVRAALPRMRESSPGPGPGTGGDADSGPGVESLGSGSWSAETVDGDRKTIVNVGAGVGTLTTPGLGVYTGSKRALESVSDALRQEVAGEGVDVAVVTPGVVATDFYDRALDELDDVDRSAAYADLYRVLDDVGIVRAGGPGINRPERVAETILRAASADRAKPVYRVGALATGGTLLGAIVPRRVRHRVARLGVAALASDWGQRLLERLRRRQRR